ncbi:RidA family protein [Azospirillum sp. RWY-5-1]|uniref:RidA family protein n=1 Tax=Azospirillum oleiclasticum TaxID=2735135 RepID=A0ABX2TIQ9_9PROT|nr:RidA family protein [Azospirillum oleiclasticum]NYZ18028.1 RidA family protein [Azospirillum oleiclasticum]NYZ23062.1 RidA family protein [Azospirillum oleiclasticum]
MTNRKTIFAEHGAKPAGQYSHAIVANGFVYVSGQGPHHPQTGELPPDFAGEVRQTLRNLEIILKAAGTDLAHVVKVNSYLTDLDRFKEYNALYTEFFPDAPPARTTIGCLLNGIQVEIDCIAVLPEA